MTSPNIIDLVQKDWFESWQDPDNTDFVWLTFRNKDITVCFTRKHFDILVKNIVKTQGMLEHLEGLRKISKDELNGN